MIVRMWLIQVQSMNLPWGSIVRKTILTTTMPFVKCTKHTSKVGKFSFETNTSKKIHKKKNCLKKFSDCKNWGIQILLYVWCPSGYNFFWKKSKLRLKYAKTLGLVQIIKGKLEEIPKYIYWQTFSYMYVYKTFSDQLCLNHISLQMLTTDPFIQFMIRLITVIDIKGACISLQNMLYLQSRLHIMCYSH